MIYADPKSNAVIAFRVTLGHNTVVVEGIDREDAIRAARRRFSDDMPRLWDVIRTLDSSRFEVESAS